MGVRCPLLRSAACAAGAVDWQYYVLDLLSFSGLRQQGLVLILKDLFAGEAVKRFGDGSFDFAEFQRYCIGGNSADFYPRVMVWG